MPIAVTTTSKRVVSDRRRHQGTIAIGVYATGGVAFAAKDFGLNKLDELIVPEAGFLGAASAANFRHLAVDRTNKKIMVFTTTAGAITEVGNGTNLTTLVVPYEAIGS